MKRRRSASGRTRLGEVGEDALIASLLRGLPVPRGVIAGAGDDCAILESQGKKNLLVLKTDCVVEKIHFALATDPIHVGWKAMMRALSDFAAISAVPQVALITLIVPAIRSTSWVKKLYRGLRRAASRFVGVIVWWDNQAPPGAGASFV